MSYVEQTLGDLRRADHNEAVAQLRYQHEMTKE